MPAYSLNPEVKSEGSTEDRELKKCWLMIIKASTTTVGTSTTTFSPWYLANRTEYLCKIAQVRWGEQSKGSKISSMSDLSFLHPALRPEKDYPISYIEMEKSRNPIYDIYTFVSSVERQMGIVHTRGFRMSPSLWQLGLKLRCSIHSLSCEWETKLAKLNHVGGQKWCVGLYISIWDWKLGLVETQPIHYGTIEPLGCENPR